MFTEKNFRVSADEAFSDTCDQCGGFVGQLIISWLVSTLRVRSDRLQLPGLDLEQKMSLYRIVQMFCWDPAKSVALAASQDAGKKSPTNVHFPSESIHINIGEPLVFPNKS